MNERDDKTKILKLTFRTRERKTHGKTGNILILNKPLPSFIPQIKMCVVSSFYLLFTWILLESQHKMKDNLIFRHMPNYQFPCEATWPICKWHLAVMKEKAMISFCLCLVSVANSQALLMMTSTNLWGIFLINPLTVWFIVHKTPEKSQMSLAISQRAVVLVLCDQGAIGELLIV